MAPTKRCKASTTKHKPETTIVGERVLDLIIPYIHNVEDRSSVSLVSRNFYEIDRITRKHVTVHVHYYPNPSSLTKRFPFIEALTLKGPPCNFIQTHYHDIGITPWIEQLALEFRYLKELHMRRLDLHDEHLHTLARTRGKDLRSLTISSCDGFSTDGLTHVSNYCNQLRTLCLECCDYIKVRANIWIHQLALNSTVLERLHLTHTDIVHNAEDITLLAKKCCNSLISLKIGRCYLSKLGDTFEYALRLEHVGCYDQEIGDLVGFQFPPSVHSLSINYMAVSRYSIVLPFLNQIRELKLVSSGLCQCSLFKECPNLEVLCTVDKCGDMGFQVIGKFCKKLRKLNNTGVGVGVGVVTHLGVIDVARGCTNLESLEVSLLDISNEALECVGTHLKNLRKFRMNLAKKVGTKDLILDNGIRAMLMGCSKLERLHISLWHGGLTDVGFKYIGEYGANLRSLSLDDTGMSNSGLVKLSEGCPRLRKLKLYGFPFSKQAVASSVFNLPSLRYVWGLSSRFTSLALTRPESQLQNIGRSKSKRKSPRKVEVDVIA